MSTENAEIIKKDLKHLFKEYRSDPTITELFKNNLFQHQINSLCGSPNSVTCWLNFYSLIKQKFQDKIHFYKILKTTTLIALSKCNSTNGIDREAYFTFLLESAKLSYISEALDNKRSKEGFEAFKEILNIFGKCKYISKDFFLIWAKCVYQKKQICNSKSNNENFDDDFNKDIEKIIKTANKNGINLDTTSIAQSIQRTKSSDNKNSGISYNNNQKIPNDIQLPPNNNIPIIPNSNSNNNATNNSNKNLLPSSLQTNNVASIKNNISNSNFLKPEKTNNGSILPNSKNINRIINPNLNKQNLPKKSTCSMTNIGSLMKFGPAKRVLATEMDSKSDSIDNIESSQNNSNTFYNNLNNPQSSFNINSVGNGILQEIEEREESIEQQKNSNEAQPRNTDMNNNPANIFPVKPTHHPNQLIKQTPNEVFFQQNSIRSQNNNPLPSNNNHFSIHKNNNFDKENIDPQVKNTANNHKKTNSQILTTPKAITIQEKTFEIQKQIGRGGTSRVFKANSQDGNDYAIKTIILENGVKKEDYEKELDLLTKLKGESGIIQLIAWEHFKTTDPPMLAISFELGELDFKEKLTKHKFMMLDIKFYWRSMLSAVQTIHNCSFGPIIHSDLKPANFVFVQSELKLIDFGIANIVNDPDKQIAYLNQAQGTPNYIAPETLMISKNGVIGISVKTDIWSLGCILYQMTFGRTPFALYSQDDKYKAILSEDEVVIPEGDPSLSQHRDYPELIDTIQKCLRKKPRDRPTIKELLEHRFLLY